MIEYARDGLFGVLTPQANTTVEPEFWILAPPGMAMITARLTSTKPVMEARLEDYLSDLDKTLDRFANAPLRAAAFACTGASYLVDAKDEAAMLAQIEARRGYPVITAANAVGEALRILRTKRAAMVSPYGDPLNDHAMQYWQGHSIEIAELRRTSGDQSAFHPVYTLAGSVVEQAVTELRERDVDTIVLLGTGLATLPTQARFAGRPIPVVSPNLCLMWRIVTTLRGEEPSVQNLRPWLDGRMWIDRFRGRY